MLKNRTNLTRRGFLKRAAFLASVPTIVPSSVFGRDGKVPPSERIILGGIGIGSRGRGVLQWMLPEPDVQFVATCDPQKSRAESVKNIVRRAEFVSATTSVTGSVMDGDDAFALKRIGIYNRHGAMPEFTLDIERGKIGA